MYRVLLVDDEPLILAGIKSLVDWREAGCELAGSARNGTQALTAMEELRPDIVIADINMPVMNGIELLTNAETSFPETVFIILTNLQEFELVRESLRHRAVDYLVKTQLDTDTLQSSLALAKEEAAKRQKARGDRREQTLRQINETQLLSESLNLLMLSSDISAETEAFFQKANIPDTYLLLAVQFSYPEHLSARAPAAMDFDELFRWEREVVAELIQNCFSRTVTAEPLTQNRQILILVWDPDFTGYRVRLEEFYKKLVDASGNLIGIHPYLMAAGILAGVPGLRECRRRLGAMEDCFYLTGTPFLLYDEIPAVKYQPLGLSGITASLKKELNGRNGPGCAALIDRAVTQVVRTPHEKSQALWLCTELYATICDALAAQPDSGMACGIFFDSSAGHEAIRRLLTKEDVVRFLTALGNELQSLMQSGTAGHGEIIEQVKKYVYDNIEKRITLHETAARICLSAGYLSALYKRYCGENFMDFVNRCKIEKACEWLKDDEYLIREISERLSFENAYYFARVFKRYVGITPSEYRSR